MDNNEAREMDYADTATGPDPFDIDPTGAGWIISPEFNLDHCPACGFDLGTHRPTCPTLTDNRNRQTDWNYCANCGMAPCLFEDPAKCTRYMQTQPITLQQHETHLIVSRIDALTDTQRRDALVYLSGRNDESMNDAIRMVTR